MWYLLNYLPRLYVLAPCGPSVCDASHRTKKRRWSSPSYWITLCKLCLTEEQQRATATCWQPPHTTDWNLDLTVPPLRVPPPPSPQCSLFPVPSCLTIPFFFIPVQLSCPTYWVHWVSFSLHVSLFKSNPPLLCFKHTFFFCLLQKRSWLK